MYVSTNVPSLATSKSKLPDGNWSAAAGGLAVHWHVLLQVSLGRSAPSSQLSPSVTKPSPQVSALQYSLPPSKGSSLPSSHSSPRSRLPFPQVNRWQPFQLEKSTEAR